MLEEDGEKSVHHLDELWTSLWWCIRGLSCEWLLLLSHLLSAVAEGDLCWSWQEQQLSSGQRHLAVADRTTTSGDEWHAEAPPLYLKTLHAIGTLTVPTDYTFSARETLRYYSCCCSSSSSVVVIIIFTIIITTIQLFLGSLKWAVPSFTPTSTRLINSWAVKVPRLKWQINELECQINVRTWIRKTVKWEFSTKLNDSTQNTTMSNKRQKKSQTVHCFLSF